MTAGSGTGNDSESGRGNANGGGPATGKATGASTARAKRSERRDDLPGVWVAYGKLVRLFRERAKLTRQQLADAVGYSVEQVASVEQGRRPAKIAFTEAAEKALGALGALAVLQDDVDLAKLPMFFQDFAQIEAGAVSRYSYDPLLVPGLLQTEAYSRALFDAHCPPLAPDEIEQLLEARQRRQAMLTALPPIEFSFVIGEAVLRCPVGGTETLRAQLHHLLNCAQLRNVEIQVIPIAYGAHAGIHGPMVLVETAEQRHVAYFESNGEGHLLTDPRKVSMFGRRHAKLRSQALNGEESARLIERIAGEL